MDHPEPASPVFSFLQCYDMAACSSTVGNASCRVCHPGQAVQTKTHPDQFRRRRSSNADILESIGLPTTGSFHDMKSQPGSTLHVHADGMAEDGCCGIKSAVRVASKAARLAVTATKRIIKTAPAGDSAPDSAPEQPPAYRKHRKTASWTEKLVLPAAIETRLQKRGRCQHQHSKHSSMDSSVFRDELPESPASGHVAHSRAEHRAGWKLSSLPHGMPPSQWLRKRVHTDLAHGRKNPEI